MEANPFHAQGTPGPQGPPPPTPPQDQLSILKFWALPTPGEGPGKPTAAKQTRAPSPQDPVPPWWIFTAARQASRAGQRACHPASFDR